MRHLSKKLIGWMLCLAMAVGMLPGMGREAKAEDSKIELWVQSADYEWSYDGEAHTYNKYTVYFGEEVISGTEGQTEFTLSTGDKVTITPLSTTPITHVTESPKNNEFVWTVENEQTYLKGIDRIGKLSIIPATLTVVTASACKVYDDSALTALSGSVSGFVSSETATFSVTGKQTEIGESLNTYALVWDGTAKKSDYDIVENLGTLTVYDPARSFVGDEYIINMSNAETNQNIVSSTGGGKTIVVTGTSTEYNLTIEAKEGEEITVLFRGVNIDVSGKQNKPAVLVLGEGKVIIQLESTNTVSSPSDYAGIQKSDKVALTITSSKKGKLMATGGNYGAGIGGGDGGAGYRIIISGDAQVTATGGDCGAGIGGGNEGAGSGITISDNAQVTAIGGDCGAGIGGGYDGNGANITINDNAQVTATGGNYGAGIGGGFVKYGYEIKVYDMAMVSVSGGKEDRTVGAGAGVGNGGSYDGNYEPVYGIEEVITFTDDDHKTFNGNVLYYEKGSSAEKIKNGEATRINSVTVTLMANDGTEKFAEQIVSVGVPTNLQKNPFTREGHSFIEWNTQSDGKGTTFEDQFQQIWGPNTILYAQWTDHVYDQTVADETKYLKSTATCTKAAVYYKSCACGAFDPDESGTFESGNPLDHDYKDVAGTAKDPTCTEVGKEADQKCEGCGDVITGAEIAKLAHTFDQEVATDKYLKTPADCTHKAVYYKSCSCGAFDPNVSKTFETGSPLGHNYQVAVGTAKAATCTETGKEADQECSRCHDVITGTEIVKIAHTFDQEVATDKYLKTPADCTHKAVYYKSCACGEKGTETFESGEALGHKWKAATGSAPKTCEACGATEGDVIEYNTEGGNTIEYTQGDTKDVVKTYHRSEDDENTIDHYQCVKIDGKVVPVDAKSGSVIITFDAATLNALSVGDHIITVIFDDWVEELKLIIKAPVAAAVDATPVTGDAATPFLWAAMVLLSMAGVAVMVEKKRRRA